MRTANHYVVLDGNGQTIAGGFTDLADAMRCARTFGGHEVWRPNEAELVWCAYDEDTCCYCGKPIDGHQVDANLAPRCKT